MFAEVVVIDLRQPQREIHALLLQHFGGCDSLVKPARLANQSPSNNPNGIRVTGRLHAHNMAHNLLRDSKRRSGTIK